MSKFMLTSICEDIVTTKEFDSDYLYDVVERFEEFLRGCGYFFDGRLDIVNECESEEKYSPDTLNEPSNHQIFESPDKGKTVYIRTVGSSDKKLYKQD
jgi:hypothetical protein